MPSTASPAPLKILATPIKGVQLLMASYSAHRYDRHVHDTYSVGMTFKGVQSFHCRGQMHDNTPGKLIAFNPDEMHDGHAGNGEGFAYAMLYATPEALIEQTDTSAGALFLQPTFEDTALAQQFAQLVTILQTPQAQESLRAQERMSALLRHWVLRHGRVKSSWPAAQSSQQAAKQDHRVRQMRDYLYAHLTQDVKVEQLASMTGISRIHATRLFANAYGMAPHQYLNALRVLRAKQLIASGSPLAEAATDAGFADQAHMSKRFQRAWGLSPGRYKQLALH
jgi:AraC-like DNA-binding protein